MAPAVEEALGRLVRRVRTVRRWLVLLSVLKAAALCFALVTAYVAVYAYVDHHVHMGVLPRLAALSLLIAGALFVLYRVVKSLVGHISCRRAANYIESKIDLDQQLVTAVEYHEDKADYPYSEALANYLVRRVYRATSSIDFRSTVARWQAYLFAAVIFIGLCCVGLFMHSYYVFFSTYLARLTRPLDDIEPLPATTLVAITKDVVAPPDSRITLAAEIRGRVPEKGSLVISDQQAAASAQTQIVETRPRYDEDVLQLKEEVSLKRGKYRYRFEAGEAVTDWHNIHVCSVPRIKNMTARVTLPGTTVIEAYIEKIEGFTLGVIRDSDVDLKVETTEKLSEAHVTGLSGRTMKLRPKGKDTFTVGFTADREGLIKVELIGEGGISNRNLPPLRVVFRENEIPQFKLVSPEGDYLATNVASVPVIFEVTDDFGLEAAAMYFELPGGDLRQVLIPIDRGARTARGGYTLELEDYDLRVGDSIVVHAEATDTETAVKKTGRPRSKSDVYFVEIMPYRVSWVPPSLGVRPPGKKKQQPDKKQMHDALIYVLEYTRAILKKTWAIASKDEITKEDRARLDSINEDVGYCTEQLALIRDDPRCGFDRGDVSAINLILGDFDDASHHLSRHNAASAIPPENKAYRGLRKLVDETWKKLCPPGSGTPPERPDRLRLAEHVHLRRYDSKRIQRELKRLADSVAETATEQEKVQREFDHFLAQQLQGAAYRQKTMDEQSWIDPNAPRPDEGSRRAQHRPGQDPGANVTVEGSLLQAPPGARAPGALGVWPAASGGARKASPRERMQMLRARQAALRGQASRLKDALAQLPGPRGGPGATGSRGAWRAEAERQLGQAVRSMDQFERLMKEARYKSLEQNESLDEASRALDEASEALALARDALYEELSDLQPAELASGYREVADRLFELAEAVEGQITAEEMAGMLAELQDAERLLGQIAQMQSGSGSSPTRGSGLSAPFHGTPNQQAYYNMEPAPRARLLANRFLTLAIQAAKEQSELIEPEPSDADLYEVEKAFFENAAKYTRKAQRK